MERGAMPYWLTLTGPFGCGKTMLARQVFDRAAATCNPGRHSLWIAGRGVRHEDNRRPRCCWFTADSFVQAMGQDWGLPEYLRADYLVAIDDLGRAKDTAAGTFTDGLCRLADNRMGRWTLWTTNLSYAELGARLDARIASRLIRDENKVARITAKDYALASRSR
jgi:DNA replication protein DnaC